VSICAAIACRVQSERLYGKPLQRIEDKSILEHLVFQLSFSKKIDKVVLAIAEGTGNEVFVEVAKKLGAEYVFGDMDNVTERLVLGAKKAGADPVFNRVIAGLYAQKMRIRARRYSDPPSQAVRSFERKTHSL